MEAGKKLPRAEGSRTPNPGQRDSGLWGEQRVCHPALLPAQVVALLPCRGGHWAPRLLWCQPDAKPVAGGSPAGEGSPGETQPEERRGRSEAKQKLQHCLKWRARGSPGHWPPPLAGLSISAPLGPCPGSASLPAPVKPVGPRPDSQGSSPAQTVPGGFQLPRLQGDGSPLLQEGADVGGQIRDRLPDLPEEEERSRLSWRHQHSTPAQPWQTSPRARIKAAKRLPVFQGT